MKELKLITQRAHTMDVKQLRYLNSRYLLKNQSMGISNFAEIIGRSQSLASAYVGENPTKNIGDKIARLIESKFEMPYGWLDREHAETNLAHTIGKPLDVEEMFLRSMPTGSLYTPRNASILQEMHGLKDRIADIRNKISSLQRDKYIAMQDMEKLVEKLFVDGFADYGFKRVDNLDPDDQATNIKGYDHFAMLQKAKETQYDLVFCDNENNLLGLYTWVMLVKQYRTPMPSFNIDIDHPDIDARVGLIVYDGDEFNAFIIPISDLLAIDSPALTIETREEEQIISIEQDEYGSDIYQTETGVVVADYRIGHLNLRSYKNNFDISLNKYSSREQMERMKSYLEAKAKDLERILNESKANNEKLETAVTHVKKEN